MKIVIDIPEFAYIAIKKYGLENCKPMLIHNTSNAIKAGTPLENILDKTLDKLDKTIVDALDNSENQVECQTLRWVLDVISEVTKYGNSN